LYKHLNIYIFQEWGGHPVRC